MFNEKYYIYKVQKQKNNFILEKLEHRLYIPLNRNS